MTRISSIEEIKHLQQPELAEIRRRNKVRDRIGAESLVAQIVAFAA